MERTREWPSDARRRSAFGFAGLLLAASVLSLALPARADALIYWATGPGNSVGRADLDGSDVSTAFIGGGHGTCGVAVDGSSVYWANSLNDTETGPGTTLGKADLNGSSPTQSFVTGASGPCWPVRVDRESSPFSSLYLYWVNSDTDAIAELHQGFLPTQSYIAGAGSACGLGAEVDSPNSLWWAAHADGSLMRQGSGSMLASGVDFPCGVAVNGQHVYWANNADSPCVLGVCAAGTTIGRADLDGNNVDDDFITGANRPCGVAVDSQHIYWSNSGTGTIGRANLDGTNPDPNFVPAASASCGIAVDAAIYPVCTSRSLKAKKGTSLAITLSCPSTQPLYEIVSGPSHGQTTGLNASTGTLTYTPNADFIGQDSFTYRVNSTQINALSNIATVSVRVLPPNDFSFAGFRKNRRRGTAKAIVEVPGPGTLKLVGKGLKASSAQALAAGKVALRVKPKGKLRRKLRMKGRARATLRVTFTPTGGEPHTESRSLRLIRRR